MIKKIVVINFKGLTGEIEIGARELFTGNHGVGKSVTIEVIAKQLKYDIVKLNVSVFKSAKNISDIISKILIENNILSRIGKTEKRKKLILIDEHLKLIAPNFKLKNV